MLFALDTAFQPKKVFDMIYLYILMHESFWIRSKELQHLKFLLVGGVGGGLGLQLVYGNLDFPQQQTDF